MLFNTKDDSTIIGGIVQGRLNKQQAASDAGMYKRVMNDIGIMGEKGNSDWFLNDIDLSKYDGMSDKVEHILTDIQKKLKETGKTGTDAIGEIEIALEDTEVEGSKLINTFKGLGKSIVNGLASAAISAAISFVISGLVKIGKMIWDNLLTDNGKIQRMKDAISSLSSVTNEYIQSNKDLDDVIEKYEELNTKLSDENITATEAFEIKKDLIGLQDELKEAYGAEASSVDLVTGSYEKQLEVLQDIKKEKASDYLKEAEKKPEKTFWDYFIVKPDALKESNVDRIYDYLYGELDKTSKIGTRDLVGNNAKTFKDIYGFDPSILEKYSALNYREMFNPTNDRATMLFDFTGDRKTINDQLSELFTELRNLYPNNPEVQAFMDEVGSIDIGFDSDSYNEALKEARQIVDALMITDADDTNAYDLQERAGEAVKAYNEALAKYQTDRSADNEAELQKASDNLNSIENEISNYAQKNADYLGNYLQVYQDMFGDIMGDKGQTIEDKLQEKFYDSIDMSKSTGGMLEKQYKEFIGSLDEDDYKLLATIDIDDYDSLEELRGVLDEMKETAKQTDIEVEVKASDAVDSMADAKTAITSLEELWNQTVQDSLALGKDKKYLDASGNVIKQLNDKNQAVGFADPALINSVESAFYKFSEQLKKEGNDAAANEINSALEEFEKTLIEFPGDADKAQEAIDNLITAYIDQTDIIQNLTEENAEWSKAQLKAYGVTNAEEVVMSRLNNTTRQLTKQFREATSALNTLTSAQEGSQEYNDAADNISGKLSEMFTTNLPSGEQIIPNFDASWVIENLNLLTEAANGSVEAMWKVQQEAAKKIAMQIDINAPNPAAVNDIQNQINSLISNFDIKDVTVGTSINTSPMIKGLNSLVDAGVITRDSMNAILSGIGVEPQVTYKDIPISVNMAAAKSELRKLATTGENYYNAKNMLAAIDNGSLTGNVRVPVIDYVATNKAVGAKYAAPSGGSSSSGGGGGGGGGGGSSSEPNKPKQEAEETFDWIEVAIQRIEEEIARLDKVVGNTYDFWTNRNKALLKEIDKTREEIKAQQIAYSEYLRNANKVEVNNGKGLNPDDYGENDAEVKKRDQELLDEAKAAWKTGEYQKKVREGLLTGDDIENIANHFLSDTIKSYQEL